jgi:hypothetical protein
MVHQHPCSLQVYKCRILNKRAVFGTLAGKLFRDRRLGFRTAHDIVISGRKDDSQPGRQVTEYLTKTVILLVNILEGIVPFQPPTFLYDLSKIPVDDAPGGFGICLRPRRCGDPQGAIEPINRNKIRKSILQKMKHFFCLVLSKLYFSFFHILNQFLF